MSHAYRQSINEKYISANDSDTMGLRACVLANLFTMPSHIWKPLLETLFFIFLFYYFISTLSMTYFGYQTINCSATERKQKKQ